MTAKILSPDFLEIRDYKTMPENMRQVDDDNRPYCLSPTFGKSAMETRTKYNPMHNSTMENSMQFLLKIKDSKLH